MYNLTTLPNGVASSTDIFFDGHVETFKLSIISKQHIWNDTPQYEFAYVTKQQRMISLYSGGVTGLGCDLDRVVVLDSEGYTFITDDLHEVMRLGAEAGKKQQQEYQELLQHKQRIRDALNNLPKIYKIKGFTYIHLRRHEVYFDKNRPLSIRSYLSFENTTTDVLSTRFNIADYLSSDHRLMYKKFKQRFKYLFPDAQQVDDTDTILKSIVVSYDKARADIERIKLETK